MFLFLVVYAAAASAQDIIVKKNGEDVKSKVLEIDSGTVRYKLFDEPDGATYVMNKSEILMIRHESGRNEIFETYPVSSNACYPARMSVTDIRPGMKYRELKGLYDYSEWYSGFGDRYNPALMGVCSWLIPGLGQMISGEVGRGFAWLGGSVGCYVLVGLGAGLNTSAYSYYDGNHNSSMAAMGTIMLLAGYLGLLTVDICAIVDACRVAKVRNMYEQDLRRLNYSFELHPSVNYIGMDGSIQPTAGLTLAMKF